jgi:hypothetical protein
MHFCSLPLAISQTNHLGNVCRECLLHVLCSFQGIAVESVILTKQLHPQLSSSIKPKVAALFPVDDVMMLFPFFFLMETSGHV